jgi:23S rRNA pseudouridine1911/1915/1917 synthase
MAEVLAPQTLIVNPAAAGVRLDVFLARHADISRVKLQAAIKQGHVTVNGKTVKPNHSLKPNDTVIVAEMTTALHQEEKRDPGLDPVILFEDEQYLVIMKPSGLVVHGGPGIHEPTLVDWLVDHVPNIGDVGDQPDIRPGIVHRLDRDVSGVMVVAKTQPAFLSLKRQFQDHSIEKQYLALAQGRVVDQSGRINFAIARSPGKSGLMIARPKSNEGKAAETLFRVERYVKGMTLVHVQTLTGRTHQIRVHFKAIGHPLVGDPLYKIRRLKMEKLPAPRVFLHAERLAFDDLEGQRREFTAPLPPDLQHFLDRAG